MSRSRRLRAALRLSLPLLVLALVGLVVPAASAAAPGNDNWSNASVLALNTHQTGDDTEATAESGEPGDPQHTLWYSFSPNASSAGLIKISVTPKTPTNAQFSTEIYTGSPLSALRQVSPGTTFTAAVGTTYWIQVDSLGSTLGQFDIVAQQAGTLAGRVTLQGAPLNRFCVVATDGSTEVGRSTTDSAGHYEFDAPAGTHTVSFTNCDGIAANAAPSKVSAAVTANATTTLDQALQVGAIVTGTITVPSGQDVTQASATAATTNLAYYASDNPDKTGHYRLTGVEPGASHIYYFLGGESNPEVGYKNIASPTAPAQLTVITLKSGCTYTMNANLAAKTTTLVSNDCAGSPACKVATANADHKAKVFKKKAKKLKKAKKKHRSAKKIKKLKKAKKKAKRAKKKAAASAYAACH